MKTGSFKKSQRSPGRKKAQAMVEFALVLPILLLLVFGIIEFGRLFYAWILIENATRFGIRYASTGNYDPTYCSPSPCSTDTQIDAARIPSIKDETRRIIIGMHYDQSLTNTDQDFLHITVCSAKDNRLFTPPEMGQPVYASCTLTGTPNEDAGAPGQRVVVAADYNFTFLVLPVFGFNPMLHLASYREGIVEQFRATRAINTPLALNIPTVPTNTPLPTLTFTPTATFTVTATFTATATSTSTNTPTPITPTNTPTITLTPSITPTRTPTPTPKPTKTPTPIPPTPTITLTPSKTPTPTITLTPSKTPTPTITLTPSKTPTPTITLTPSRTPTPTPIPPTPTITPTKTKTPIPPTPTITPTPTKTPTPIPPTNTPTRTPTPPASPTPSPTPTPTVCFNNC